MGKNKKESQDREMPSQPSEETKDIFPLAAKEIPELPRGGLPRGGLPPKPAPEPPLPESPQTGERESAHPAPIPQATAPGPVIEVKGEEIKILFDGRKWRVRGLGKNMNYDQPKVNILVSRAEIFYVDTFDLYSARSRALFLKQAAEELRVKEDSLKSEPGKVLFELEELQDKQIKDALEPKEQEVILTPEEKAEALKLLQDPNLFPRILSDFEKCGVVGEETNKLVGYLAAVSRKLTFLDDQMATRDNVKYLSLIETITLLFQHQRPLQISHESGEPLEYLEVTLEDIEIANKLTHEILGHSLGELPPQSRRFLMLLEEMVIKACERLNIERTEYRFYRRDILDNIGWTYDQIRVHMERLIELEYVLIHRGQQGQRFSYELLYDGNGKDGKPFCVGLIDTAAVRKSEDTFLTLGGKNKSSGGETLTFGGRLGAVWGWVGLGWAGVGESSKRRGEKRFKPKNRNFRKKRASGGRRQSPRNIPAAAPYPKYPCLGPWTGRRQGERRKRR